MQIAIMTPVGDPRLNVRLKQSLKDDLQTLADFHGLTISSYVHMLLVKHVRTEKEATPSAFLISNAGIIDTEPVEIIGTVNVDEKLETRRRDRA